MKKLLMATGAALIGAAPSGADDGSAPTDLPGFYIAIGSAAAAVAAIVLLQDDDPAPALAAPARRNFNCNPAPTLAPGPPVFDCAPDPAEGGVETASTSGDAAAAFAALPPRADDPRLTLRSAARPGHAGLLVRYRLAPGRDASLGLAAARDGEAAIVLRYSFRF